MTTSGEFIARAQSGQLPNMRVLSTDELAEALAATPSAAIEAVVLTEPGANGPATIDAWAQLGLARVKATWAAGPEEQRLLDEFNRMKPGDFKGDRRRYEQSRFSAGA